MGRKWLDNYGKQENYNDSKTYFPSEFEGLGYSVSGRNYSPSWGGQFQTGGIVTNEWEGEDVSKNLLPHNQIKTSEINYLKDWLNSPMANKIANQRNNKNAKQNINARLERLSDKNLNIKTVEEIKDKGNSFDKRRLKGFENPNLQGRSYTSPGHSYGDIITRSSVPKNVFVHEGSHVSTGGNTLLPENDITDILSRVKDDSGTYYSNPTEVQARLNVFRKELKESGIVDPFKTPVTKQQLKTFLNKYKSPTDKSNKPLLETNSAELINTVKSEDDVLWMLNNIVNNQNNELIPIAQNGVIKDNNGYWNPNNWGKVVEIDSNDITMKGVNQPLLGISDEGDVQYMEPNKDYKFKGKKVREFPIAKNGINNLDENSLQQLDQLTNFTNYNKLSNGGWLDKF